MAEEKRLLKFVKVIGITAAVLVGLLIAALLLAIIIYPPAYVYRVLVWRESDNDDYRYNFPKKPLMATNPVPFPEAYQLEEVAAVFEQQEGIGDWEPLGMAYDGWWSLDSQESGFEKMEAGLNGPARDFAKFGQLFLQQGESNGEQVLPRSWVQESTAVDPATQNETYYAHAWGPDVCDDGHGYYKYMWYGFFRDEDGAGETGGYDFAALGDHGQIIYVAPSKNLVIVRHGTAYGNLGNDWAWTDILYQFVSDWEE